MADYSRTEKQHLQHAASTAENHEVLLSTKSSPLLSYEFRPHFSFFNLNLINNSFEKHTHTHTHSNESIDKKIKMAKKKKSYSKLFRPKNFSYYYSLWIYCIQYSFTTIINYCFITQILLFFLFSFLGKNLPYWHVPISVWALYTPLEFLLNLMMKINYHESIYISIITFYIIFMGKNWRGILRRKRNINNLLICSLFQKIIS